MRCPHCAGEILDGSRFCGICGRRLASATIPAVAGAGGPAATASSPAATAGSPAATAAGGGGGQPEPSGPVRSASPGKPRAELIPVSERILAVLALDVALAGAGVAMILSFARDCEGVRGASTGAPTAGARARAAEMPEDRP
jgi:hypothetical protein